MSECEVCGKTAGNEGPFNLDDGRRLASVCGGCKIRLTFADPVRKARFEREVAVVAGEMLNAHVVVEVKP